MDAKQRAYNENPYIKANIISKIFLWWVNPLLLLGRKRTLTEDDLYVPVPHEETKYLTDKLEVEWNKEMLKPNPKLWKALFRMFFLRLLAISSLQFIREALRVVQPIWIGYLIDYFSGQTDLQTALIYGSLVCLISFVNGMLNHMNFQQTQRYGMRMRIAVCGLIYRKMLKLSISNNEESSNVEVINLMSNDASRIEHIPYFSSFLLVAPIQTVAVIIVLINLIDYSILSGLLAIAIIVPIQVLLGRLYNRYKLKTLKITDERINITTEVFNGIKVLKMYCWEEAFANIIKKIRIKELKNQAVIFFVSATNSIFDTDSTPIITFISISIFYAVSNMPLRPSYIVMVSSYYMIISSSIQFFFMRALVWTIGGLVGIKRVQEYLLEPETIKKEKSKTDSVPCVHVSSLHASWTKNQPDVLKNISFDIESNGLLAVVGTVGAGKTSLFMALLHEMPVIKGNLNINGSIFYVSQEPWIFSATIKQNILFGKDYNEAKFNRIIEACALGDDLLMQPYAENTYIGDKGVNLSGGQRARISLARALYADADIYFLDDPLSAVDANVGKHLFNNCVNGYLKSKIRILVTHQVHFLTNVDQIILIKDGAMAIKGRYNDLISKSPEMAMLLSKETMNKDKEENKDQKLTKPQPRPSLAHHGLPRHSVFSTHNVQQPSVHLSRQSLFSLHSSPHSSLPRNSIVSLGELNKSVMEGTYFHEGVDFKMVEADVISFEDEEYDEKRQTGAIGWNIYKTYLNAACGIIAPILLIILFAATQGLLLGADYWVSLWANQEDSVYIKYTNMNCSRDSLDDLFCLKHSRNGTSDEFVYAHRYNYFIIYLTVVLCIIRSITFYGYALFTTKKLHEQLLLSVIHTRIRFFDLNPIGRVLNRFSKDVGNIDDVLPLTLFDLFLYTMLVLGTVILASVVNFWILVPLIPVLVVFVYLRKFYIKSSREIKRIEGLCRSPLFMHATNTSTGIVTIRACHNQEILCREFETHSDYHTQACFALICVSTWFAVYLDIVVAIYTLIVVFGCTFLKDYMGLTPGEVGIALVYLIQMMGLFQWCIQLTAQVENLMTSAERISEYTKLEAEEIEESKVKPDESWPKNGEIVFNDVSFAYDESLPNVLKNVTFKINAKEKVGVVGRTGAGKSTIFQTLFRMAEPDGTVLIDGINIKDISLHDLRSKISIIPQEPTLFIGPLRYNLDPFGKHDDNVLWNTLEIVQLKDTVKSMQGGLDAQIQKSGGNLSVGQKQLFCLARAVLKRSKILIIDEATANVDYKTDALVQKAIRECFGECTVITIAHRLHTIMDTDKIICLSNGCLINIGRPYDLLNDPTSILYKFVQKLGKEESEYFLKIASGKIDKTQITPTDKIKDLTL